MHQWIVQDRLSPKVRRDIRGMNAVELMIGLTITVIMATISLPLVNNVIANSRLDGAARQVASDLRYTQSLAVTRGNRFRLNAAAGTCAAQQYVIERSIDGGNNWSAFTQCYMLGSEYQGATLASITGSPSAPTLTMVDFNSRGTCVNCTGNNPPILVKVQSPVGERTIQVRITGGVSILPTS